eukprot:GILJ01002965.1.p1 GENE.GILJ01002965.1~~GILJ01002965.1.p1  ORF type:complete len:287 (-),score=27.94 GILJ01002965.1:104-964(-)
MDIDPGDAQSLKSGRDVVMQDRKSTPDMRTESKFESDTRALEEDDDNTEESSEEDDDTDLSASEEEEEETTWIQWFCSLKGNEFFCEVDEDYIQDDFNLTGLSGRVPYYEYALDVILDVESPVDDSLNDEQQAMVESAAEMLYGLIHARFLITGRGMATMSEKYSNCDFGRCPRVFCEGQHVVPVGQSDVPRHSSVRVFCPRCRDIYNPRSTRHTNLDGAYFGTSFAHLFFMTYPELIPTKPVKTYIPRVYGFKVHSSVYDKIPLDSSGKPLAADGVSGAVRKAVS